MLRLILSAAIALSLAATIPAHAGNSGKGQTAQPGSPKCARGGFIAAGKC